MSSKGVARLRRWVNGFRALRLVLALTMPSYLHPDEHFQNAEIAYSLFFASHSASPGSRTWEWNPARPCRSIVPVWLTTGWALWLLSLLTTTPSANTLLLVERMAMFVVSLVTELIAEAISSPDVEDLTASLLFSSSSVALVWLVRPFSNSLSALLLLPLFAISRRAHVGTLTPRLLDVAWVICALGVWTRIDFIAFAAPIALYLVYKAMQPALESGWTVSSIIARLPSLRLQTGILAVAVLIGCDTRFFERSIRQPVVSPLGMLRYNTVMSNFAEHGQHPHWLHLVVNMPLLFGVGFYCALMAAWRYRSDSMMRLSACSLLSGVLVLSVFPHQEPRFLLPCIVPISMLIAKDASQTYLAKGRKWRWRHLWILHCVLSIAFFGFLHHGGTLPALAHIERRLARETQPHRVVVWKTLMPPPHLTLPSRPSWQTTIEHQLVDAAGTDVKSLARLLLCDSSSASYLIAPIYQADSLPFASCLRLVAKHGWHVDPDHFDKIAAAGLRTASVGNYKVENSLLDIPREKEMAKIAVVLLGALSFYGHIATLAEQVAEGAKQAGGVQVDIFQVEESFSKEVLGKMHAAPKKDHPTFKAAQLADYDGILFGLPTRYGRTSAQIDSLFDRTGGLWAKAALKHKLAGIFFSTGTQHGGQETTAMTTLPFLVHHGMIFVPLGFERPELNTLDEICGGSAWGAGTIAGGDGSRKPTQKELALASAQGEQFAGVVSQFKKGSA